VGLLLLQRLDLLRRSYRKVSPEGAAEDLARIREPNVFLVDDVAFIQAEHGYAIGRAIERRGIRKEYYLETRCDVLIKNEEVFAYWRRLGLHYMFLGVEALDEEGLKLLRKRVTPNENFKALEIARKLGFTVALNIIADPDWDERRFEVIREWALSVPEVVHLTVSTALSRHRDVAHRVAQAGHAGLPALRRPARGAADPVAAQALLRGTGEDPGDPQPQAPRVGRRPQGVGPGDPVPAARPDELPAHAVEVELGLQPDRQYADHQRPVEYEIRPPRPLAAAKPSKAELYVHMPAPVHRPTAV